MRGIRVLAFGVLGVLGVLGAGFAATPALAKEVSFSSTMTSAEEVPDKGPDGATGAATVNINTDTNEVCYKLSTTGLSEAPNLGHIHQGAKGVAGPVVVDFNVAANGLEKCVAGDAAKVAAIVADPSGFYVNLHTATYPKGALRGQLAVASASVTTVTTVTTPPAAGATTLATTGTRLPALLAAAGLAILVLGGLSRETAKTKTVRVTADRGTGRRRAGTGR